MKRPAPPRPARCSPTRAPTTAPTRGSCARPGRSAGRGARVGHGGRASTAPPPRAAPTSLVSTGPPRSGRAVVQDHRRRRRPVLQVRPTRSPRLDQREPHQPELYIGSDGELRGESTPAPAPRSRPAAPVNDGKWHDVVLTAAGNEAGRCTWTAARSRRRPGQASATPAAVRLHRGRLPRRQLEPDEPHCGATPRRRRTSTAEISDVACGTGRSPPPTVSALYPGRDHAGAALLTKVTRPRGRRVRPGDLRPGDRPGDAGDRRQRRQRGRSARRR